ncbi:MAG: hypothetical protein HY735_12130 [Verrucomicrobia bacterium]|nr:hypothetical protein [Verrucomicrobiota bacterium]
MNKQPRRIWPRSVWGVTLAWSVWLVPVGAAGGAPSIPPLLPEAPAKAPAGPYDQSPERGPHHRVRRLAQQDDRQRQKVPATETAYVEVQTGLYYLEQDRWWMSKELIDLREHHAVAYRCPLKVVFKPNINRVGVVDLTTPEGLRLRSHVLGLTYFDAASGKNVVMAEMKDSVAQLVAPNQLVYKDAFTGLHADVRYTYTKAGLEQDVILLELPASPAQFGLNPESTRLEVLTEFWDVPAPVITSKKIREEKNPQRRAQMAEPDAMDEKLEFGNLVMGLGKAFQTSKTDPEPKLDSDPNNGKGKRGGLASGLTSVPVAKRWITAEGRQVLAETVEYEVLREHLEKAAGDGGLQEAKSGRREVSLHRVLPRLRPPAEEPEESITVANVLYQPRGLVVDYYLVRPTSDFTFAAGRTYHVNGELYLTGTTVIEEGAVIKFGPNSTIRVLGTFKSPGRTAYLTSEEDRSVGVDIPQRRGADTYASPALSFYQLEDGTVIRNLEIRYASVGIENYSPQTAQSVENCRFFKCQTGVEVYGTAMTLKELRLDQVEKVQRNLGGGAQITEQNNLRQQANFGSDRSVGLQYDHGNSMSSATWMGANDSRSGYLDFDGDYDYFRVEVSGTGTLTAYTTGSTDTYGYLYDSSGWPLAANDDNPYPNFRLSASVSTGIYYVAVRHYSYAGRGSYTLYTSFGASGGGGGSDDHGNDIYTATSMGVNDVRSGTINYSGDEDYFWINVYSSGTLTAYTSSSIDTYGYLLNSNGSTLTYDDDAGVDWNFYLSAYVSPGTYYVRVRHYSSSGTGSYTLYTSFSASTPLPSTPTGLAITPLSGDPRINLSWASALGASGYYVKRWNGSTYALIGSTSGAYSTSYTDVGLASGTAYYYTVSAYNSAGESANSSVGSATTAPSPPTNLSAYAGSGYVNLSWSAPYGVYGYNVKRATTSGGPFNTTIGTTFSPSYSDYSVSPGTTYYYVVTAFSVSGAESYNSVQASGTPPAPPPSAPAWLTATPGIQQIYLHWPSSAYATSYNVKRWNGSAYETIASTSDTTYIQTGLASNATHSYVVSASNSAGTSGDSPVASATTAPAAPTGVGASGGVNQITLSWFWVSGASSYRVKRLSGSGGSVAATYSTSNTSYTETGLSTGTTYYYVVSALNSSGTEGPNSSQVSATTTSPDSDGDGLLDSWEYQYFGNLSQNGSGDFDGDGVTNYQEYQNNTNPAIANATVKIARPRSGFNFP